ncbi:leucine-rich repeat protein, putative [Plasmodium ovale]|uniref:Leucine-rich repeat protein (LRR10) n=2 Tax=Plasmodium ovale TaxID=36330 RepID=A0A1A8VUF1_PLAOA|nr:leucine-rich repeat protein (LRR10) [Plasmodium ovale curtisi]SBS92214.1 leucine-rich repeat protein (LRR10) [Plasmodium ovale curtisi]SCP04788.1 leucine-rich repeat protein, putative [Plasmodium ovale]
MKELSKNDSEENISEEMDKEENTNVKELNSEFVGETNNNGDNSGDIDKDNSGKNSDRGRQEDDPLFHIKSGLSQLERTLSGEGYAFCNLICKDKNLGVIPKEMEKYVHLKYVNMSHNKITDIENLYKLNNIIFLDLSYNLIKKLGNLKSIYLKNCLYMNMSYNLIKIVEDIKLKNIMEIDLSNNEIDNLNIYCSNTVKKLILSNNNIKNIHFKNILTNLEFLDISSNPVENLQFYEIAPNINTLKINNNCTLPINQLCYLNNFKNLESLDMENYLYFKDISYKEVKQILLQNSKDLNLIKFNGNRILSKTTKS